MFLEISLYLANIHHGLWQPCSKCRVENPKKIRISFTSMRLKSVLWVLFLPQQGKYRSTHCSVHFPHVCRHQHCQGAREGPVQFCGADLTDWDRAAPCMDTPLHSSWNLLSLVILQIINCSSTMSAGSLGSSLSTRTATRNPTRQEKSEWFNKNCDLSQNSLQFYRTGNHEEFHSNILSDVTQDILLAPRNLRQSTNMWPFPQPSQSTSQIASFGC